MVMNQQQPIRGPIVEDETLCGGFDDEGATVIKPKTVDGKADESMVATDARESSKK
jgi:hypothetical protein